MVRETFLPYCLPSIGKEEFEAVAEVMVSGWLSSGPKVDEFEKDLCKYTGCKHAVVVNSCTAALHLSLLSSENGGGDEVITSPYTFASTGNMIMQTGARPVFIDIDRKYNIDVSKIEEAITERTKAIIPVHFAGHPCDMKEIREIADEHDLFVIEDAAHAIGSEYQGEKIGSQGTACFSFYPTKNMTTGEGGAICTDDEELAEKARILRANGINRDTWKRGKAETPWHYDIVKCGWKYNLSDIHAAIGIQQLKKLDDFIDTRIRMADIYDRALKGLVDLPPRDPGVKHSYHLYPILVAPDEADDFIGAMRQLNIGCSIHFIPLHLHSLYRQTLDYKEGDFPNAEQVFGREVSLPLYPSMTEKDQEDVINTVNLLLGKDK